MTPLMCIIFEIFWNFFFLIMQHLLLQGIGLLVYLRNKLKVDLYGGEFEEKSRSKNVHKVFGLGNKHLNNLWGRTSTYISLSNLFSFAIFFSYLLSFGCFWAKNMYMCYPNLFHSLFCFIGLFFSYICFAFRFGARSTTSHVWGLLTWGSKHIY